MASKKTYNDTLGESKAAGLLVRLHIDLPLLLALLALCSFGYIVLLSAADSQVGQVERQFLRLVLAFVVMIAVAQIPLEQVRRWSLPLFIAGVVMLVLVLFFGEISKGARRWLDLGVVRFQPSEVLKLAVPMALAWLFSRAPLPPGLLRILLAVSLAAIPIVLIARQPDLGTAILVASAAGALIFLAGLSWRLILVLLGAAGAAAPVLWMAMHDYQRRRVLTFLDPQSDPLGAGYHIIQSQIAIGSGGIYGKGWFNGTQSHLEFLPERSTDFIFAVLGEEFGLVGILILLSLYLLVIMRGLYIALRAQDTYSRLLSGSLIMVFFVYLFVNTGMVVGLLPVVGVPLPLVSYGGTSLLTIMVGFGLLMRIATTTRL